MQQFSRISSCKTGTLYPWRDNSHLSLLLLFFRLPWFLSGKESACNAGDVSLIPRSGRSPREGNGEALEYSCLENPMDRGAWQATVHVVPRVGHNLATKPPPPLLFLNWNEKMEPSGSVRCLHYLVCQEVKIFTCFLGNVKDSCLPWTVIPCLHFSRLLIFSSLLHILR